MPHAEPPQLAIQSAQLSSSSAAMRIVPLAAAWTRDVPFAAAGPAVAAIAALVSRIAASAVATPRDFVRVRAPFALSAAPTAPTPWNLALCFSY